MPSNLLQNLYLLLLSHTILHVVQFKYVSGYVKPKFAVIWDPLWNEWDEPFDAGRAAELADVAKGAYAHAYSSYISRGFPADDVRPLSCLPSNSQGGVALSLLDALDAHLVFGARDTWTHAAGALQAVSFDVDARVHVFELTIRGIGALVAAHAALVAAPDIISPRDAHAFAPRHAGGGSVFLEKALDLAARLLPAFATRTGIPRSWVNLRHGVVPGDVESTCVACAATLAPEMRLLSHFSGNATFAFHADKALRALWRHRSAPRGLVGNTLDTRSGAWERRDAGVGAGADSYYEYLLKTYLIFGEAEYLEMFVAQYVSAQRAMAMPATGPPLGTSSAPMDAAQPPPRWAWLLDVHMDTGRAVKAWVSSLAAFWPGLQALVGQIGPASRLMANFTAAYASLGWLPEQVHVQLEHVHPMEVAHPLRPELLESAAALYAATGAPRYLRTAQAVLETITAHNAAPCGFASVRNVSSGALEDGMESFFVAETAKYAYAIFASPRGTAGPFDFHVVSTEGHLLPVLPGPDDAAAAAAGGGAPEASGPRVVESSTSSAGFAPRTGPGGGGGGPCAGANSCGGQPEGRQREQIDVAALVGASEEGDEDMCDSLCAHWTPEERHEQVRRVRAAFPLVPLDAAAAARLRRRRCTVCRAVAERLAAQPRAGPCARAAELGIVIDQPCRPPGEASDGPLGALAAQLETAVHALLTGAPGAGQLPDARPGNSAESGIGGGDVDSAPRWLLCSSEVDSGGDGLDCDKAVVFNGALDDIAKLHVGLPANVLVLGVDEEQAAVAWSGAGADAGALAVTWRGGTSRRRAPLPPPLLAEAWLADFSPPRPGDRRVTSAAPLAAAGAVAESELVKAMVKYGARVRPLGGLRALEQHRRRRSSYKDVLRGLWRWGAPTRRCAAAATVQREWLALARLQPEGRLHAESRRTPLAEGPLLLAEPADACSRLRPSARWPGSVLLVERGNCTFAEKAAVAARARAAAMLVYSDAGSADDGDIFPMAAGDTLGGCTMEEGAPQPVGPGAAAGPTPDTPSPFPAATIRRDVGRSLATLLSCAVTGSTLWLRAELHAGELPPALRRVRPLTNAAATVWLPPGFLQWLQASLPGTESADEHRIVASLVDDKLLPILDAIRGQRAAAQASTPHEERSGTDGESRAGGGGRGMGVDAEGRTLMRAAARQGTESWKGVCANARRQHWSRMRGDGSERESCQSTAKREGSGQHTGDTGVPSLQRRHGI